MTEIETTTVEQTLRIAARPETVWRYWTDPERMCEWWGASADIDPRPGGICRIETVGGGPTMRGEFLELVPHERIVFSFGWESSDRAPAIAPGSTRVEVMLTPDAGDTILTVRHSGVPMRYADEHREGWEHFLPLLAQAAAPGRSDVSQ